jgi:hypothetical protein
VRVVVAGEQQIPNVIVPVPARTGVRIDVNELRAIVRMRHRQTEFFGGLAHRRSGRLFTRIDVPTWLQPDAETLVDV